jgi:uncharacterized protein YkwD
VREQRQLESLILFSSCARSNIRLMFAVFSASGFILVQSSTTCIGEETNATVRQSPYFESRSKTDEEGTTVKQKSAKASKPLSVQELEQHMFELINQDRSKAGAPALTRSPDLSKLARELADDMMRHDYFGHITFSGLSTQQRAKRDGIVCSVYENIGTRSGPDPALQMVDELEQSFMGEPVGEKNHRYVLILPIHTHVGVGIAKFKDSVIVVQNFTDSDPAKNNSTL